MSKGNAVTEQERREVVERLLAAWASFPRLSLGQFLVQATEHVWDHPTVPIMYQDDHELAAQAEKYARDLGAKEPSKA